MSDRPIIFSAPMVRELLAGRKTQTRRSGEHLPVLVEGDTLQAPQMTYQRVGKKAAGRRLHGVTHDGVPR